MRFSIVIAVHNAEATLPALLNSLSKQTYKDFEVILVDDASRDHTVRVAQSYDCSVIALSENHGPAYCRNRGAESARGEILAFTDSDCKVEENWLESIGRHFQEGETDAVMGKLKLIPSNYLGGAISALGFPAGGSVGYDKIWRVDERGYTNSLSTCNCAIKRDVFWTIDGFDESFPYPGGEDTLLAYQLREAGYRIKYCSDVLVYHPARDSLGDFVKWQFKRGISSFLFSKKISKKADFISLRIWSTRNILSTYIGDRKFPLILFLLCTGYLVQAMGFLIGRNRGY